MKSELEQILDTFAASGWDLIAIPSKAYLNKSETKQTLVDAIQRADAQCGDCGCEFDRLYKRCLDLLSENNQTA